MRWTRSGANIASCKLYTGRTLFYRIASQCSRHTPCAVTDTKSKERLTEIKRPNEERDRDPIFRSGIPEMH